jgi:hydroxymethylbilane synthase
MSEHSASDALVIGTRGSLLARAQSEWVIARLAEAHPGLDIRMRIIRTTGDTLTTRPLPEIGGKGLFTLELESALREGAIDVAVHSAKDLPTALGEGLAIVATPTREDPRDAWVSSDGTPLDRIPPGSVIGTSSLRRQAQLLMHRADLTFVNLRGNVDTRIRKIHRGDCAGAVLAMAGLIRAGLAEHVTHPLDAAGFIPAPGQGTLALEARAEDPRVRELLEAVHDADTSVALECERAVLAELDAGCRTPMAVFATVQAGTIDCRACVADPLGRKAITAHARTPLDELHACAAQVVAELRRGGAAAIIAACRPEPPPTP